MGEKAHISKNSGFTLLELIITMAVALIFTGLVFSYLLYNTTLYAKAHYEAEIQRDCTEILEILTIAAKESSNITVADVSGDQVYTFTNDTDPVPVARTKGTATFSPGGATLTIVMDGIPYLPYENITSFSITGDAAASIRAISITGSQRNETLSFQTTVTMRNWKPAAI